ncbi:hypothetical protein [Candidatus Synchoanobacter obligatus]|uniref:Uncharacterized protein n=1 Tax=Candidatus Synchoanobacter obligatus TaxID=2919597 RepID=A0ABT1L8X1_9GAMM|nr:hypothetical protein [Candidatus Synchoanobacter obligatus]MCP8352573.1 hypothetical protein [Candidatus Synchoanobacter obligatus]
MNMSTRMFISSAFALVVAWIVIPHIVISYGMTVGAAAVSGLPSYTPVVVAELIKSQAIQAAVLSVHQLRPMILTAASAVGFILPPIFEGTFKATKFVLSHTLLPVAKAVKNVMLPKKIHNIKSPVISG